MMRKRHLVFLPSDWGWISRDNVAAMLVRLTLLPCRSGRHDAVTVAVRGEKNKIQRDRRLAISPPKPSAIVRLQKML